MPYNDTAESFAPSAADRVELASTESMAVSGQPIAPSGTLDDRHIGKPIQRCFDRDADRVVYSMNAKDVRMRVQDPGESVGSRGPPADDRKQSWLVASCLRSNGWAPGFGGGEVPRRRDSLCRFSAL